jgi:hypothetical protein
MIHGMQGFKGLPNLDNPCRNQANPTILKIVEDHAVAPEGAEADYVFVLTRAPVPALNFEPEVEDRAGDRGRGAGYPSERPHLEDAAG